MALTAQQNKINPSLPHLETKLRKVQKFVWLLSQFSETQSGETETKCSPQLSVLSNEKFIFFPSFL